MTEYVTLSVCKELLALQLESFHCMVQMINNDVKEEIKSLRKEVSDLKAGIEFTSKDVDDLKVKIDGMER